MNIQVISTHDETGKDLEGEALWIFAERWSMKNDGPAIVWNEITGEAIAIAGDWNPGESHMQEDPITAAHALAESALSAPIYGDEDVIGIVFSECDYKAFDLWEYHAPRKTGATYIEAFLGDDARYIDRRGGRIYRAGDWQYVGEHEWTRPEAEEHPEDYLDAVANSEPQTSARLIDPAEHGWRRLGQYNNGMYRSSRSDNPEKIRDACEERGFKVVFIIENPWHPFDTDFTAYVKRA